MQDPEYEKFDYDDIIRDVHRCYLQGQSNLLNWVCFNPEKAKYLLIQWYELDAHEVQSLVEDTPEDAVDWISDLFTSESVTTPFQ